MSLLAFCFVEHSDNISFFFYSVKQKTLDIRSFFFYHQMADDEFRAWNFFDYLNDRGDNEIHLWLNSSSIPMGVKAKINARLFNLQGFRVWPEQYVSVYKGWDKIIELKIVYGNVHYRLLRFYWPGRWEFTLLKCGVEKGKLPRSLLEVADERRHIVIANTLRIEPHDFS